MVRIHVSWRRLMAPAMLLSCLVAGQPDAIAAPGPDGSIGGLKAKFVDVKGVKTRYYDEGQGEPMVLIHGGSTAGSSTANVWSRNIPGLAKRFHVYAVDRLGSGLTGNPLNDADYAYSGPGRAHLPVRPDDEAGEDPSRGAFGRRRGRVLRGRPSSRDHQDPHHHRTGSGQSGRRRWPEPAGSVIVSQPGRLRGFEVSR